jgi:hypothetical protein
MTDKEALDLYDEIKKMFGEALPDPDHYPKQFAYFVSLYRHSKKNGY